MIDTYDNSATPTGDTRERSVQPPPVDQDKLRAIIGEAVKSAEENDPKLLKKKVAELQAKLDSKAPSTAVPAATKPVVDMEYTQRAVDAAISNTRTDLKNALAPIVANFAGVATKLRADAESMERGIGTLPGIEALKGNYME